MGFCCKILSLNDLTPSPISRPGTHCLPCLQWQQAKACANLWWRHKPFPGETSITWRPCAGKTGVAKRSWWCFCIISSNRCQFSMISQILEEIHLWQSAGHHPKPLVYSSHCSACWSQGSYSNSAREISRTIFSWGGVGRHVVLSVCYTKLS